MPPLAEGLAHLDAQARLDSPVHRIHPVAATGIALLFVLVLSSFPAHAVSALLPLAALPLCALALSGVSPSLVTRQVLRASPFVLALALPSLFLDREVVGRLGPLPITGGVLVVASVAVRAVLAVSTAVLLVATQGIEGVAWSLGRLGLPGAFAAQVVLLYRYLHVLGGEAGRMTRARDLRAFGHGRDPATWGALVGSLLLRALARGERVGGAMRLRGFDAEIRPLRVHTARWTDAAILATCCLALAASRALDLPAAVGTLLLSVAG